VKCCQLCSSARHPLFACSAGSSVYLWPIDKLRRPMARQGGAYSAIGDASTGLRGAPAPSWPQSRLRWTLGGCNSLACTWPLLTQRAMLTNTRLHQPQPPLCSSPRWSRSLWPTLLGSHWSQRQCLSRRVRAGPHNATALYDSPRPQGIYIAVITILSNQRTHAYAACVCGHRRWATTCVLNLS
jgi:hypothetical protein